MSAKFLLHMERFAAISASPISTDLGPNVQWASFRFQRKLGFELFCCAPTYRLQTDEVELDSDWQWSVVPADKSV